MGSLVLQEVRGRVASRRETRVYRRPTGIPVERHGAEKIRRDALEDLLAYQPTKSGASRQAFLSDALERLEGGQHVYTHAVNGRLMHAAWLMERGGRDDLWCPGLVLPPKSVRVDVAYTRDGADGERSAVRCLEAILAGAKDLTEADAIFIRVDDDGDAARRRVEAAGFAHVGSFVDRVTLGYRRRRAAGFAPELITPPADAGSPPVEAVPRHRNEVSPSVP